MFGLALLSFTALLYQSFAAEVCYEPCGCFNDNPPFDTRPLPESYNDQEISWLLYTQGSLQPDEIVIKNDGTIDIPPSFDSNKETKILIHGWNSGPSSMEDIKDAYMEVGDYNVIVVDWNTGATRVYYPQSASNTQVVGACTSFVSKELSNDLGNFHCTGWSLGGQSCGYFGSEAETLGRITGLDPAGPYFETFDESVRLDNSDADFVDVIHTQAPEDPTGDSLGMRIACGHVDFYPNKAGRQPGCPTQNCDHGRSRFYMASSIRNNDCFPAYPCESDADADAGLCDSCSGENCQLMGEPSISQGGLGTYYLTTTDTEPYCPTLSKF